MVKNVTTRKGSVVTVNYAYRCHKRAAKMSGFIPLPRDIWNKTVFSPCHYCGEIDQRMFSHRKTDIPPIDNVAHLNGIDRVDSDIGYLVGNCVSCCMTCNRMKSDYSQESFLAQARKMISHLTYRMGDKTSFWGRKQSEETVALGLVNPKGEAALKDPKVDTQ